MAKALYGSCGGLNEKKREKVSQNGARGKRYVKSTGTLLLQLVLLLSAAGRQETDDEESPR
jgi:hypothetical protein